MQSAFAVKGVCVRRVGRNSPCPCGSGKKYKRCHMRIAPAVTTQAGDPSGTDGLRRDFRRFSQIELVSALAGLQMFPPNHSQTIRLQVATRAACSMTGGGSCRPTETQLANILEQHLPASGPFGMLEVRTTRRLG